MTTEAPAAPAALQARSSRVGDRVLRALASWSGIAVLVITGAIGVFLVAKAVPALRVNTVNFLTTQAWNPDATPSVFGVAALVFGTVLAAILAMAIALPIAVGVALFISHYAPRGVASVLGYVVDLLAAVPSVIYGLWGVYVLAPRLVPVEHWLNDHFGWIPLFAGTVTNARTMFTVAVVLPIMILPIIAAVSREVFLQVPRAHIEAALALGATRWEAIRIAVLPFGRPGVISAAMLGLGRALGETIAVALVLSTSFTISFKILEPGGNTIAANIANSFAESGPVGVGALIASGLVLFVVTLVVNMIARAVVLRRADFAGANS